MTSGLGGWRTVMPTATARLRAGLGVGILILAIATGLFLVGFLSGPHSLLIAVAVLTAAAATYLLWQVDPAVTFSSAIVLSPFAGNWQYLHFPHGLDPDRILLSLGILQLLLRAPAVRDIPRPRLVPAHVLMVLALLYVLVSAYVAGTLFQKDPLFKIIDAFGLLPFLTFLVAPLAFRTPRQRSLLLAALVALGVYLGLTTLFVTAHLNALVFPKYILNPSLGIHYGRGRGPFLDAVANGFALFVCAAACGVAVRNWSRGGSRGVAAATGLLCLVSAFLSLERSVWIAAVAGTVTAMLVTRWLRPYLMPVVAAVAVALGLTFGLVPGLLASVTTRANQASSVWDRQNLTVAGINMLETRPLTGFGWATFQADSGLYFRRSQNYPLTAVGFGLHNFLLNYAVELGLPGFALWMFGLVLGVGAAYLTRGPPDLDAWRAGLAAVFVAFVIVALAVPPSLFPNLSLWLWAGVVFSGRYAGRGMIPGVRPAVRAEAAPSSERVAKSTRT